MSSCEHPHECQGISPRVGLSPPWLGKSQAGKHVCVRVLAPWLTPPRAGMEAPRRGCAVVPPPDRTCLVS